MKLKLLCLARSDDHWMATLEITKDRWFRKPITYQRTFRSPAGISWSDATTGRYPGYDINDFLIEQVKRYKLELLK